MVYHTGQSYLQISFQQESSFAPFEKFYILIMLLSFKEQTLSGDLFVRMKFGKIAFMNFESDYLINGLLYSLRGILFGM